MGVQALNHYLINGDSTTLSPSDVASCDVMIVDPPYSEKVHKSAVSVTGSGGELYNTRKREFGFDHLETHGKLFRFVAQASGLVKRWSVIYSDIESTHHFREACQEAGATYIRTVAWIRWSMPQLSGDRPPSGREDLLIFHGHPSTLDYDSPAPVEDLSLYYGKTKGKKAWNGPGNLTHLSHKCLRGDGKHRAEKPLDQCLDLVEWFSDEGETILDPCAGSGTVGLACAILGRSYVGFELDPQWANFARQRIEAYKATGALSDRDKDRLGRYTEERGKRNGSHRN